MSEPIIAFHGKAETKELFLARAKEHFAADQIVKGQYWEDGKGCAVGCLVHSSSHSQLAKEINIPIEMAFLLDRLFEGLPNGTAKSFPVRFIDSIPVGADLSAVMDRYFLALLSDEKEGVILSANDAVRDPIQAVINLFIRQIAGDEPTREEWGAASSAAYRAADRAAYSAACSAASREASRAASSAAYRAADRAACSAACRAADRDADGPALSNHYVWQSEILLSLLASAPVPVEITV